MAYIKFQRGTLAAYEALQVKDSNTLYFIYPAEGASVGSLYLGDKIISGGDIVLQNANLEDLADVIVNAAGEGDFLVRNAEGKWVNKSAATVAEEILAGVASETAVYNVTPEAAEDDIAAINRVVGAAELQKGDVAIIKRLISAEKGKYTHTAYIYNGTAWQAMDGNYSAENVYFDEDLTYTANIGVLAVPSSGSGTISAEGKSVAEILKTILAQEKNPGKTNPSCGITMTGGGEAEVGTVKTIGYTTTFNRGAYTYGPDTGITAQTYSAVFNGETLTTPTGTFAAYTVPEDTKRINLTVTYNEGAVPKTNLGNPYEAGKIAAGSCSATSGTVTGYRNMFYGAVTTDAAIDSDLIRSLAGKKKTATGNLATFGAVAGAKKIIVAVPAARRVSKVLMPSAMNADATANFVLQDDTVEVEGANGFAAIAYKVYVYQPAAIDPSETYLVTIA